MGNKYKLTEETCNLAGITLYRIEAVKDFGDVHCGDKGGWVENESNLSQDGNAWISGEAKVYGNALIHLNARVCGGAHVYDDAQIYGDAKVYGNAKIYGYALVYGDAIVCDSAVYGNAKIHDNVKIYDGAEVYDDANISGNAWITGNAKISNLSDYIVFKNWWSSGRYFTWTRSNNMWKVGCFYGTGDELIAKAYKDSNLSGIEYERVVKYVESISKKERFRLFKKIQ